VTIEILEICRLLIKKTRLKAISKESASLLLLQKTSRKGLLERY
jgi:hypothetical protein